MGASGSFSTILKHGIERSADQRYESNICGVCIYDDGRFDSYKAGLNIDGRRDGVFGTPVSEIPEMIFSSRVAPRGSGFALRAKSKPHAEPDFG